MSYRINKDESLTPYADFNNRESLGNFKMSHNMNRRACASQNKSRPMSYTFQNSQKQSKKIESRVLSAQKEIDSDRIRNIRSTSRRAKLDTKITHPPKRMKRAETVGIGMAVSPESKIKLRKELNDMTTLKYHISPGKIEQEYLMTSTILGSGSYAIVKLGESVANPEEKVAIKIYEKNKLYTNKHRRRNLCNEIMVLKTLDHKNIVKIRKVFEDRAHIYLIMEYIKGMSLYKYIKNKKTQGLGDQEVRFIFKEILSALVY